MTQQSSHVNYLQLEVPYYLFPVVSRKFDILLLRSKSNIHSFSDKLLKKCVSFIMILGTLYRTSESFHVLYPIFWSSVTVISKHTRILIAPINSDCLYSYFCIAKKNKVMRRQSTFILHHASHPWSRSRVLIWMVNFLPQVFCFT